jgi:anaerobic magnesium-protoporphyrin IX monomethyl ester cyclase
MRSPKGGGVRIVLIPSFNIVERRIEPYVPYGLLSLQAAAKAAGRDVELLELPDYILDEVFVTTDELVDQLFELIPKSGIDIYGFSTVCNSAHLSLDLADRLKAVSPSSKIIVGGPYGTKIAQPLLRAFSFLDAIAIGEGETTIARIVIASTTNEALRSPGLFGRNGIYSPESTIDNLDNLPFVGTDSYYSWLDSVRRIVPEGAATPLEATRGCPLKCSFCSTKQVWGPKVRRKSAGTLVEEMKLISARTGQSFFSLIGDNVGVPRAHFLNFCLEMISLNSKFTWGCSLKMDKLKPENIETMYKAGCRAIFIGLESASQRTLDAVNKAAKIAVELQLVRYAIKCGMHVETSFIIGFPWETEDDIRDTYSLHCSLLDEGAFRSQVSLLSPIPGTEIVAGHKIIFDGMKSYMTDDGMGLSEKHRKWLQAWPDLFSHFGHYETPNIARTTLKAFRDASSQISALHTTRRKQSNLIESGNHGRALGATYPYGRQALNASEGGGKC